jgi:hypothetical protein
LFRIFFDNGRRYSATGDDWADIDCLSLWTSANNGVYTPVTIFSVCLTSRSSGSSMCQQDLFDVVFDAPHFVWNRHLSGPRVC